MEPRGAPHPPVACPSCHVPCTFPAATLFGLAVERAERSVTPRAMGLNEENKFHQPVNS